jgi:hypothetical protein
MRRIFAFFISLLTFLISRPELIHAQDTLEFPLKIKVGVEVSGPVIYLIDPNTYMAEGYIAADLNETFTAYLGGGYLNYKYSQYNYEYLTSGGFMRAGADINLLKPEKSKGIYYTGVGLRYGLSRFTAEVPTFYSENYWGVTNSSIPAQTSWAHFVEFAPGVRAELFKNFSMGWTISLRMLLYTGADDHFRPIRIPGFGDANKKFSTGINYFLVWNIPYKKIKVITKKKEPEEEEEEPVTPTGTVRQGAGIRQ